MNLCCYFEVCYFLVYTAYVGIPFAFGKDDVFSGTGSCPYCTTGVISRPEHFQAKHVKHAIYFKDNGIRKHCTKHTCILHVCCKLKCINFLVFLEKYCVPCFCLNAPKDAHGPRVHIKKKKHLWVYCL